MTTAILADLQASSRVEAALDNPTRIQSLWRDRWIDYPRASQALLKLEHLLETPPKERMPCMVLHGDSNIRKTLIVATLSRSITPTVMIRERRSPSPSMQAWTKILMTFFFQSEIAMPPLC